MQDFEALTPNLLARTVETVEGGGIVCLLLRTMNSLKQLYTLNMVSASACIHTLCNKPVMLYVWWRPLNIPNKALNQKA